MRGSLHVWGLVLSGLHRGFGAWWLTQEGEPTEGASGLHCAEGESELGTQLGLWGTCHTGMKNFFFLHYRKHFFLNELNLKNTHSLSGLVHYAVSLEIMKYT